MANFRPAGSRPQVQPAGPAQPQRVQRAQGGTLGSFATDMIQALGGTPTPQAQKLFNSWQRWEGGWSANSARYNPLNLTAPGSGLPTINSVGVVSMPSYQEGVRRTADLIKSGYPALAQAFRSGQVNFQDPGVQADLNRWLSGKRTPGMTPYVSKIARSYGANVPAGAGPTSSPGSAVPNPPSPPPQAPTFKTEFNPELFREQVRNQFLTGGGRIDLMGLPGTFRSSFETVMLPGEATAHTSKAATGNGPIDPSVPPTETLVKGKGITLPFSYKSTHVTDGLTDEGFTRAIDIMGAPGTAVSAPMGGVVRYFHPTGAQGGGSMLVRFSNGREGWIGHIANGLPAGTKFKPGAVLSVISSDHRAPHVHWSLR